MNKTPMKKAALYGISSLVISMLTYAALILVALYVPENLLLHRGPDAGSLETWMPPHSDLPEKMVYIRESMADNQDIAANYENPDEMVAKLDNTFERIEGYLRRYVSANRCRDYGARHILLNITSHPSDVGAKRYFEFVKERDIQEGWQVHEIAVGENAFTGLTTESSLCLDTETEFAMKLTFIKRSYMVTISMSALKGTNQPEDMLPIILRLAQGFDDRLPSAAANP